MTRSATERPPPHDWARAPEQTLRDAAEAAEAKGELETGEAAPATRTGWPNDTGEAHRDGVLECGQHGELGRKLTKRINAGHVTTESTIQKGQRAKSAL